ncbi:PQQ-binding-like beta-propeller repeat protein [Frondihabitans sp. 4ASC-45]|uniref:outer membrane protein assembly factor BamB family protein n=1 Tax=Frondihabitans sp. 4ASC-45 TaxID=3111636 RepID=UPI003C192C53
MADIDPAPWSPERPPSQAEVWQAETRQAETRRGSAAPGPGSRPQAHTASPGSPTPRRPSAAARSAPRPGLLARRWSRASSARRILVAYVALASAIAGVVGFGAALQPNYGSLSPLGGIAIDDLRAEPSASLWALDLAATLAPGAPAECLRFTTLDVGRGLVAVRAESSRSLGFADDSVCSVVPDGFRARIALLDTGDGTVDWVHDTSSDLDGSGGVAITSASIVQKGERLLVNAADSDSSVVESLSLRTGDVMSSTGSQPWSTENRFAAEGDVVAIGRRSDDGLTYEYELRNASDLGEVVWRGQGNPTATMIALDDRLLLGEEGTRQIRLSTGRSSAWGSPINTSLGYAFRGGIVYAPRTAGTGVTTTAAGGFSAISRDGTVLWTSDLTLRGSFSLTRSCLAVTNFRGDRLSCLDYRTGRALWTRDVGSISFAGSAPGQRSDDIYTVSTSDTPQVVVLEGATGRERYRADVSSGSYVVATGQTVGYVLAYGISGSRTTMIAFDLSSGRRLWSRASQLQVSLWGGHLVDVGLDGLVRRLAD